MQRSLISRISGWMARAPLNAALAWRAPVARRVMRKRLSYLGPQRMMRLVKAIDRARHSSGDVCEFGVALGGSGIVLASRLGPEQRYLGFDVFGIIPEPTSEKDDDKSRARFAVIAAGKSEGFDGDTFYGYRDDLIGDVRRAFARHGVPEDGERVQLVQGLFEATVPEAGIERIALAHIDCDWYDPVRLCLAFCAPRMVLGGIMVIDDYYDFGGSRTAVDEFLALNPQFTFEGGPNPFLVRQF